SSLRGVPPSLLSSAPPPPPPRSPLFPYTTLFRSSRAGRRPPSARDFPGRPPPFPVRGLWVRLSESSSLRTYITLTLPLLPFISSDRKSTRLNSSHVSISYAVFCLKKKTHKSSLPI